MSLTNEEAKDLARRNAEFEPPMSIRQQFPHAATACSFFEYAVEILENRDIPGIENQKTSAQHLLNYDWRLKQVFNALQNPENQKMQQDAEEAYKMLQAIDYNQIIDIVGQVLKNTPPDILSTKRVNKALVGTKRAFCPKLEERPISSEKRLAIS
ncbi:MAG: hypothetical protein MRY79_08150 [Alphaproteobacteria bacterium]|nr:hypothetical protein [Alphaproteobacteria bacterium]